MAERKTIDYSRTLLLLDIVQKASAASLDGLAREAMAELLEITADAKVNANARAAEARQVA